MSEFLKPSPLSISDLQKKQQKALNAQAEAQIAAEKKAERTRHIALVQRAGRLSKSLSNEKSVRAGTITYSTPWYDYPSSSPDYGMQIRMQRTDVASRTYLGIPLNRHLNGVEVHTRLTDNYVRNEHGGQVTSDPLMQISFGHFIDRKDVDQSEVHFRTFSEDGTPESHYATEADLEIVDKVLNFFEDKQ